MNETKTFPLADRIANLEESQTIGMAQKARELASQGIHVISLSLGEPDFQTPDHIKEAAKKALDDGYTRYSPVPGYPELRKAIVNKLKRDNGLDYKPENIVVSTGAKQSLFNVVMSLVNPGDEVVIFTPYWVSYLAMVQLAEGKAVEVSGSLENQFKVTPEQLEEAITSKTRLIMFSSPCNPTGSVFTRDELKALADVVARHEDVFVISDEIYEYINFSGNHASIAEFEEIKDRVIVVNGFAKGFAMTGWRLGYIAAPTWLAKACDKYQGQVTSGANSMAQRAGIVALEGDMQATKQMAEAYKRRRDLVLELLKDVPGVKTYLPEGAFYLFPDISAFFGKRNGDQVIRNADDMSMYLLNEAHVSTVPGEAFGNPNCIRMSFAASDEDLREAMRRIREALGKLS
ncbi:aspartate aminotransferase [Catalinimonas alkaloidigena]|uniref:Aminotransferase n=1 Tax=Catalinimonas alkaloidigena TaxID=1075417 RepID=A0A1G9HT37_9BACT|nr:pyridoxal phosphate-dependent aminotransferase [Catalinimonas alkaloidigena]SDL15884.1 aspartate aminotransferase [Catalinimonas alkaloidigena]